MVQVMPPIKASIDMDALLGTAKSVGHLSRQFEGFTGGPKEAQERVYPGVKERETHREERWSGHKQGQLFDPESVPHMEAHTQSPEQFARDPRTWWHGRVVSEKGGRLSSNPAGRDEGFHAGSEVAARQRVTYNVKRRGLKEGKVGRMFPLRITGPVRPPEEVKPDMMRHRELGGMGSHMGAGYLYKNVVEGGESEVSVGTPTRAGFLSTHREMVTAAEKQGKKVNPVISWAARKMPQHTQEAIREPRRWLSEPPQGVQMGLHEQFAPIPTRTHEEADPRRQQAFLELHPDRVKTHRTSYETQSGRTKHVWAFSTEQPGSALLSKQWNPSS